MLRRERSKTRLFGVAGFAALALAGCQTVPAKPMDSFVLSVEGSLTYRPTGQVTAFQSEHAIPGDADVWTKIEDRYVYSINTRVTRAHDAIGLPSSASVGTSFNPNEPVDLERPVIEVSFELYGPPNAPKMGGAPDKIAAPLLITALDERATLRAPIDQDLVLDVSVLPTRKDPNHFDSKSTKATAS